MSKKSSKKLGHILKKYPELLDTFNIIGNQELGGSTSDVGLKKILRKHIEKTKKEKTLKKKLRVMPKYSQSCSSQKVNKNSLSDLFTCPNCKNILESPVSLICGHTFCKGCLEVIDKCSECETEIEFFKSTNILVQDLIEKWKNVELNDADVSQCRDRYQTELRYCLRSRCNAIHDNYLEEAKFECSQISPYREQRKRSALESSFGRDITVSDLECIVCSQCLLVPVTTTCGHTFCRECLARVLDHGLACPLCMAPLKISEQFRAETHLITTALRLIIPKEHWDRLTTKFVPMEILEKTNEVPIFICTNAFPKVACPLFVYEPRYRLLSRRCVQSESKKFGMAAKNPNGDKFALYGTLLEVRDCVTLQDGTSILTTIGLRRFKVLSRGEQDGYDTAAVQYIQDIYVPSEKLPSLESLHEVVHKKTVRWLGTLKPRLLAEIERCIGCMPLVEKDWYNMPDGPTWTWWLIAILPLSVHLRVGFIACSNLQKRLLAIEKMLDHLKFRMKSVERNTNNLMNMKNQ